MATHSALTQFKRHPFAIPVVTFLFLFFMSLVGFVSVSGQDLEPSDSQVVRLSVNGTERVVTTRADTVADLMKRLEVPLREEDYVSPAPDTPITNDNFVVTVRHARQIAIIENGEHRVVLSAKPSPREVAQEAGIKTFPEDKVEPALEPIEPLRALSHGIPSEQILITRAKTANLNLYGTPVTLRTHAKTVGDLLKEKNIVTVEGDTVTPATDTVLNAETQIFVLRVGRQIVSVEEKIPAPVETIDDPTVAFGLTTVREAGSDGKKLTTYEIELQNDKEVARRPIQEVVVTPAAKRIVVKGSKVIVSNPSENVKLGERMAAGRGWTGQEWLCLYQLWQKESRWNHTAHNRNSGAYGIPQALPGSKMGTVGGDWQTNPATQITWGMGYITNRYGTPCKAMAHSRAIGWY